MAKPLLRPDGGLNALLQGQAEDTGNRLFGPLSDRQFYQDLWTNTQSLPSDLVRGIGTATLGAPADIGAAIFNASPGSSMPSLSGGPNKLLQIEGPAGGSEAQNKLLESAGVIAPREPGSQAREAFAGLLDPSVLGIKAPAMVAKAGPAVMAVGSIMADSAKPFFSKMREVLTAKLPTKAPAAEMKQAVTNAQLSGFKTEELEDSGLLPWLEGQDGKVTKERVLDWLTEPQVQTKMLGLNRSESIPYGVDGPDDTGQFWLLDADGSRELGGPFRNPREAEAAGERMFPAAKFGPDTHPTMHTPGGTDHVEMLLTLPERAPTKNKPTDIAEFKKAGWKVEREYNKYTDQTEYTIRDADGDFVASRSGARGELSEDDALKAYAESMASGRIKDESRALNFTGGHFNETPNVVAHVRMHTRMEPTYTADQIADIEKRVLQAVPTAKSAKSLGNGAPGAALVQGLITPVEAAQYADARGFQNVDKTGARSKTLMIDENQSDLHQKGRKEGYRGAKANTPPMAEMAQELKQTIRDAPPGSPGKIEMQFDDGSKVYYDTRQQAEREVETNWLIKNNQKQPSSSAPPDMPFKTSWPMLAMKRVLQHAVDNGFDRVAWTTGDMQAARYDLSQQISSLSYIKNDAGNYKLRVIENGRTKDWQTLASDIPPEKLDEHVGKEIAEKIRKDEGEDIKFSGQKILSGIDLKVGGEGLKNFYDRELVNKTNKYVEKMGGKVEKANITTSKKIDPIKYGDGMWAVSGTREMYPTREAAIKAGTATEAVHSLTITPEMRAQIKGKGQPLYSAGGAAVGAGALGATVASQQKDQRGD